MVNALKLADGSWNDALVNALINALFVDATYENVYGMFWANNDLDDKFVWLGNKDGHFSIKPIYSLEINRCSNPSQAILIF